MTSNQQTHKESQRPARIAIDGPAASGKSTIAELLADYLGYLYFDTGVMYRAVTLEALHRFRSVEDVEAVSILASQIQIDVLPPSKNDGRKYDVIVNGEDVTLDLRTDQINQVVSIVSAYPLVREALTEYQRIISRRGNVVMVGRDIGTVVIPDADLKIYLEASLEERASRRFQEETAMGRDVNFTEILHSLRERDQKDKARQIAPMRPADDAIVINTDNLSVNEVVEVIKKLLS